jgi:tetratricopeptide (TPR) repeat protein
MVNLGEKMKKILGSALLFPLLLALIPNSTAANTGGGGGGGPVIQTPVESPTPAPTPTVSTTTTPVVETVESSLKSIQVFIENKDYRAALAALKIADTKFANNADVNNLLGFSSRKLKLYKQAAVYYSKALRIDPNHLGALEYQGELFVETKKIPSAKKNLAKLKSLCGATCEEYLDLKKAIGKK